MADNLLKIVLGLIYILVKVSTLNLDGRSFDELPYCDPANSGWKHKDSRLILVSTLDGKLSALNIEEGGEVAWSLDTGPGAMLSSSIHQLELTKNGHWARMIPSLSGGLYNFNGDSVEAIPVTADNLLQSDFRYSDGSVISGGKESRTYGVIAHSGRLIYECSMEGCVNLTEGMGSKDDENNILVVRRQTQTVRAIEPQTGVERWNFSVGQHDIKFLNDHSPECHGEKKDTNNKTPEDYQVKVVVPEGIVCIVSKAQPDKIIWKQKFDAPVVHAWMLDDGQMSAVDLFSNALISTLNLEDYSNIFPEPPKLYIGMHNKQLYIQESVQMQVVMKRHQYLQISAGSSHIPSIPWKPYPASRNALDIITPENAKSETALQPIGSDSTTALSVLYASEYINGNGFYLFSEKDKRKKTDNTVCSEDANSSHTNQNMSNLDEFSYLDDEDEMPVQIIVSLWFWWKEVLAISIATALFVNLVFTQRFLRIMRFRMARQMGYKREMAGKVLPVICEKDPGISAFLAKRSYSEGEEQVLYQIQEFTSRYLTDFEPMHRLGKGGFGVVFEARNKIDDCNYAIKRIPLPNRQDSRERVMREVKALAKLDHQNIVRYFNAWLECPPPGWQEEQDKAWMESDQLSDSRFSVTPRDATSIDLSENSNPGIPSPKRICHLKPPIILPANHITNFGSDASVWLNLSNAAGSDTATKSISFFSDSVENSINNNCNNGENSDSFIVFADGSKIPDHSKESDGNSDPVKESAESKGLVTRQNIDAIPSSGGSPEPYLRQVVVVEKNKLLDNSKAICVAPSKKFQDKKWKKSVSLEITSRNNKVRDKQLAAKSTRVYLYIQMQLCRKESLREWLRDERSHPLDRRQSLLIFDQIVQAVEYVHLRGLIHRDLKPSNIFFSKEGQVKVGDFGLVTAMAETMDKIPTGEDRLDALEKRTHTAQVGTQLYMSPEQLMGKPYNYKVDIYSLGLILFELLVPFATQMERWKTLKDLRENKFPPNFHQEHSEEFQLLKLMLSQNPDDRPTTFGIRARPPLLEMQDSSIKDISESLHYNLPVRENSSNSSSSQSN